jgi:hypothetical protein
MYVVLDNRGSDLLDHAAQASHLAMKRMKLVLGTCFDTLSSNIAINALVKRCTMFQTPQCNFANMIMSLSSISH